MIVIDEIARAVEARVYWNVEQTPGLIAIIGKAVALMTPEQRSQLMASKEVENFTDWPSEEPEEG